MTDEEDKEVQQQAPQIILYLIKKSEDFLEKQKFLKSFILGMLAIIIGLLLTLLYYFRHFILAGLIAIILFYFLMYWFGV